MERSGEGERIITTSTSSPHQVPKGRENLLLVLVLETVDEPFHLRLIFQ
jgi:hypothetical protein